MNQNETKPVEFLVSQNAISLLLINGVKFCMCDFVRWLEELSEVYWNQRWSWKVCP